MVYGHIFRRPARLSAIAVAALLLFTGCDRAPAPHAVRFLALGDSYTIGQSVSADENWPNQLKVLLRQRGLDVGDPQIIAQTGWTTDELSAAIDRDDPKGPFGLVGLLIGVNDEFRGGSVAAYRPKFAALLDRSIVFAGGDVGHVFVLSIPDWGVMPFAEGRDRSNIGKLIDLYNQAAREICEQRKVQFIDVTPVSREATTQPTLGAEDGLHPSGQQYARWAALAADVIRPYVRSPR